MQKVVFVAILLLPLTVAADGPIAVTEQCPASSPARFQLVGFTAATLPGDSGLFGFTRACQAEFPGSRFCTLPDIFNTTTIPDLAVGTPLAWVEPGLARSSASGDPTSRNCIGWSSPTPSHQGMVMSKSGQYDFFIPPLPTPTDCGIPRSVSCCAPVE